MEAYVRYNIVLPINKWFSVAVMEGDEDVDSLGEKLYDVIYPKYTDMTPKLTGDVSRI